MSLQRSFLKIHPTGYIHRCCCLMVENIDQIRLHDWCIYVTRGMVQGFLIRQILIEGFDELPGLMPLTMSTILSMCEKTGSRAEISYYEVYMDRCWDLLEVKANEIAIWDDIKLVK